MKHPDADTILQLIKKLEKQSDVSPEEADGIHSLLLNFHKTKLNIRSSKLDTALVQALKEWYVVVTQKIKQGYRGNFLFSIAFSVHMLGALQYTISLAHDALNQYGCLEDFFTTLTVSAELYNSLPKWLQQLFTKANEGVPDKMHLIHKNFYVLKSPRAGMYYYPIKTEEGIETIAQFMKEKQFTPAVRMNSDYWSLDARGLFEMAAGIWDLSTPWWMEKYKSEHYKVPYMHECVLGAYLKSKQVPLILMENHMMSGDYTSTFFTEKDKAKLVKSALEIPFKDLVQNALCNKVIETPDAKDLFSHNMIYEQLFEAFVETSAKYIDSVVQREIDRTTTRKAIQEEYGWLEIGER